MEDDPLLKKIKETLLRVVSDAYLGPEKHIYAYVDNSGHSLAMQFLEEIPKRSRAKYAHMFECHAKVGLSGLRREQHRKLTGRGQDDLFEYKDISGKSRLVHTLERGNLHVLLYGFTGKNEDDPDPGQILRAIRVRDEYFRRKEEIEKEVQRSRFTGGRGR
ncbi:MAG: hypothetical protein L6R30_14110, partial [Thermoanaerobaculia bacterium]|nr:hypothetical protein [Thermoanaerobaculia bacterium]